MSTLNLRLGACLGLLLGLVLPASAIARPSPADSLGQVPQLRLSAVSAKAQIEKVKDQPLRFAVGADPGAGLGAGAWDEPSEGISRWRLRVQSAGALSLSFRFTGVRLPEGAELWVYGVVSGDVQGPLGSVGPVKSPSPPALRDPLPHAGEGTAGSSWALADAEIWSPLVRGDEALVEVVLPTARKAELALRVQRVFHGYRDISPGLSARSLPNDGDTGTGASGACNIDVACSAGNDWQNESRSVVLLQIGGDTLCTGTLVNNTSQDERALVLTAKHCGINTSAIARSTVAYFNVQRSGCASGTVGRVDQNIMGQTLLASSATSSNTDYTLFELASTPPTAFNVYYAGWDAGGSVPTSGVAIHHPSGDDKKISVFNSSASTQTPCLGCTAGGGFSVEAWAVIWSRGTTEGGSSGSALWNSQHRLVGALSGGGAQCSGAGNNGGTDFFGRLDTAWSKTSAEGGSLKASLDSGNKGCLSINGRNAGSSVALDCSTAVTPPDEGGGGGGALDWWVVVGLLAGIGGRGLSRRGSLG